MTSIAVLPKEACLPHVTMVTAIQYSKQVLYGTVITGPPCKATFSTATAIQYCSASQGPPYKDCRNWSPTMAGRAVNFPLNLDPGGRLAVERSLHKVSQRSTGGSAVVRLELRLVPQSGQVCNPLYKPPLSLSHGAEQCTARSTVVYQGGTAGA